MSPFWAPASTAILLACMYLSEGVPSRIPRTTGEEDMIVEVKRRTCTEAFNAKLTVDDYFKMVNGLDSASVTCNCSIDLPYPQNVRGCNSVYTSISINLHHLLYMYSHVLGFIYLNNINSSQLQMEELDVLEMTFYRFSNQMQRYLQAHNLTCSDTMYIIRQDNVNRKITELQLEFTNLEIAKVILCHLRSMARSTMHMFGKHYCQVYGYLLCKSLQLPSLQNLCPRDRQCIRVSNAIPNYIDLESFAVGQCIKAYYTAPTTGRVTVDLSAADGTIVLHVDYCKHWDGNPYTGQPWQNILILNSKIRGAWGTEQHVKDVVTTPHMEMEFTICAKEGEFSIVLNQKGVARYTYRMPVTTVRKVEYKDRGYDSILRKLCVV